MGIALGDSDRSKPGVDEVSGLVLSDGYFEGNWYGNIDGAGPGEDKTMGISKVTSYGIREVPDSEV